MEPTPGMQRAPTLGLDPTSIPRGGSHLQPQDAKVPPGCSRDQGGIWSRDPLVIPSSWKCCGKAGYELGSTSWEKPKPLRATSSSSSPGQDIPGWFGFTSAHPWQSFHGTAGYLIPKQHLHFGVRKNKANPRKAGAISSRITPRTQMQKRIN